MPWKGQVSGPNFQNERSKKQGIPISWEGGGGGIAICKRNLAAIFAQVPL